MIAAVSPPQDDETTARNILEDRSYQAAAAIRLPTILYFITVVATIEAQLLCHIPLPTVDNQQ